MENLMKRIVAIATVLTVSVFLAGPGVAEGATVEELQVQIAALQTQLNQLLAQLSQVQGQAAGTPAVCSGITFDRNLQQGVSGNDVKCLQAVLNLSSDTQVAASGAGSPGSETTYFGGLTKAGVVKFQVKYASEVLTPIGLTAGTGFVGPKTRAKLNGILAGTTPVTPVTPVIPVTPVAAGLTVSLASDTPAAGTIATTSGASDPGSAVAPLAKFKFTNGDSAEVKVTQLKLKRLGVSADTTLTNVYLFDGAIRLTDAASVSSGVITFTDSTGIVKVPAGGSKTVTVASDIATATSGQTVGVGIAASTDVISNASAVNGTFPTNGNLMSIAIATLATVDFNTSTTPSGGTIDPQNDYAVWQNIITVGNRAVNLTRVSLREIGTINYPDLQNFRLYVDGTAVGSAVANLDANGYVTFDLSAVPKKLEAGSRTIKLLTDIIGGSSRTFSFSLRIAADATFVDTEYGANIRATANGSAFSARTSCSNTCTVAQGVITITKLSASPSGKVVKGATNVSLGKFEVKAAGEKVKVENLKVSVEATGGANVRLRNGMLFANAVQIGSTAGIVETDSAINTNCGTGVACTQYELGSSLIVVPGSPVTLEVKADVYDDYGTNDIAAGTITALRVDIQGGNWDNAQGLVSLAVLDIPSSDAPANSLTVSTGSLGLAKYTAYTDQSIVPPLTAAKLAHFTLTANTTEAVNLDTISVEVNNVSSPFDGSTHLSNMYVKYGTQTTSVKATVVDGTTTTNDWSISYSLSAGATIDVIVYANVASTSGVARIDLTVSGTTVSSATSVSDTDNGQSITLSTGTFTAALDGGAPLSQIVSGSSQADIDAGTPKTVNAAKFKFTSQYDSFTLKEVYVKVASATVSSALGNAILKDSSGTVLGTMPFAYTSNTQAQFTGLTVSVPANTTKVLSVDLTLSVPSSTSGTSQVNAAVTLDDYKYATGQGVERTASTDDSFTDVAANNLYVYRSIPTVTLVSGGGSLSNGEEKDLYEFKVAADSKGSIALKQLKLSMNWDDTGDGASATLEVEGLKFYKAGVNITDSVVMQDEDGNSVEGTDGLLEDDGTLVVTFASEDAIGAGESVTYLIKGTAQGLGSSTTGKDSFSMKLLGDSADNDTNNDSSADDVYLNAGNLTASIVELYTSAAAGAAGANDYNFIWSDNSALAHSSTVGTASSNDWGVGYLVKNLDLASKTWAKQ